MKESIAALSSDRRLQAVLIAFCFGAFLEGTGGGGAPVAIAGSFLIGLGFDPFQAATLVPAREHGAGGLGGGRQSDPHPWRGHRTAGGTLSAMTGRILPPFSLDPADLAGAEHGRLARDVRGLAGPGGERAVVRRHAVLLVESSRRRAWSTSSRRSSRCWSWSAFLKVWQPAHVETADGRAAPACRRRHARHSTRRCSRAGRPFILSSILIFLLGLPAVSAQLTFAPLKLPVAGLHNRVLACRPWSQADARSRDRRSQRPRPARARRCSSAPFDRRVRSSGCRRRACCILSAGPSRH